MLTPLRLLLFCLIAPAILTIIVLFFATDEKPLVNVKWTLTNKDIERAQKIIGDHTATHNSPIKKMVLNEKDLNIVANHLLNRHHKSATKIRLLKNGLSYATSIVLPENLLNSYLNISFILTNHNGFPFIKKLKIGRIQVPQEYAGWLIDKIIQYTALKTYYFLASKHIKNIEITSENLTLSYHWTAETSSQARSLLTDSTQPDAVIFYRQKLIEVIRKHDTKWRLSLAALLQPLFLEASKRSADYNAIEENRAIIFVVSAYVNQQNLQALLPETVIQPTKLLYPVFIYKRIDMAKHFMGAAALTASGNAYLTYMLGVEKELHDAEKGSGFSFIDLAADRAGMRFGETATRSEQSALKLQKAMAKIKDYSAFMPDTRDLPENMKTAEFKKRFESIYSKPYQEMLKNIDQRIAACPIYKAF